MSKNKSIIRSSSGPSYPYPRSHTTMMVVPSNRPPASPKEENKTQRTVSRRRPPLNRAIPTIPESKSNESIMSHVSRKSVSEKVDPGTSSDLVIANRCVVQTLRRDSAGIPRRVSGSEDVPVGKSARTSNAPRSPLMSVAHSVRSKLTKLTRIGRSSEQTSNMRGSQSFSGTRVSKTGIPKRVDQNSNRVIKSSSMDVPFSSDAPSTSKVVIPQNPEPLDLSEDLTPPIPVTEPEPVKEIMMTEEQTANQEEPNAQAEDTDQPVPEQPPETISDAPSEEGVRMMERVEIVEETIVSREVTEEEPKQETPQSPVLVEQPVVHTVVLQTEKILPLSVSFHEYTTAISPITPLAEDIGDKENEGPLAPKTPAPSRRIEDGAPEPLATTSNTPEIVRKHQTMSFGTTSVKTVETVESVEKKSSMREKSLSPERYVMTVKTPEAMRKHHTFVIGEAAPREEEHTEGVKEERQKVKKKVSLREESCSPERYVMTVKTPETMRRHHTFTVYDNPEKAVEQETIKPVKLMKQKSLPEEEVRPADRFVMTVKTPLTQKRHQTFMVEEAEQMEDDVIIRKNLKVEKMKRSKSEERPQTRFVMTVATPLTQRKFQSFTVGEAESGVEVKEEIVLRKPIIKKKKTEKMKRSHSEEPSQTRFVMNVSTPLALRRHQNFMVGQSEPKTEVEKTILENRETSKIKRSKSSVEAPPADRYVMVARTPLTERKFHSFVVGEAAATSTVSDLERIAARKKVKSEKMKRSKSEEQPRTRFILTVRAAPPSGLRRTKTFMVGERAPSPDVPYIEEGEVTEPIATVGPMAYKPRTKSAEPRIATEEKPTEKYVMTVRTPLALRKYQTFVVEPRKEEIIPTSISHQEVVEKKSMLAEAMDLPIQTTTTTVTTTTIKSSTLRDQPGSFEVGDAVVAEAKEEETLSDREIVEQIVKQLEATPYEPAMVSEMSSNLHSSTPLQLRKHQTFAVEERAVCRDTVTHSASAGAADMLPSPTTESELGELPLRIKHSDMYILTATTPLPQRKGRTILAEERDISVSRDASREARDWRQSPPVAPELRQSPEARDQAPSPCGTLFVMGRRPAPPSSIDTNKRENSTHSDRAERRSNLSGEMTSPEEEIPMDTQMTPMEEEGAGLVGGPIEEEDEVVLLSRPIETDRGIRPVFRPPAPPRDHFSPATSSKSTSPMKSAESRVEDSTSGSDSRGKAKMGQRSSSVDKKEKKQEKERLKKEKREEEKKLERERKEEKDRVAPKTPLSARSLRSAGRIFTPSFLRKESKSKKPTSSKSMAFPTSRNMQLAVRDRRAPLAEFESTVVANSPMVENLPLTYEKWSSSPRSRRRHSDKPVGFAEPITEESDGNGNPTSQGLEKTVASPLLTRHHDHDRGLIDDEILDQPMLMGDNFSHSESSEMLSLARRVNDFEAEKATIVSIDRSVAEDIEGSRRNDTTNGNRMSPHISGAAPPHLVPQLHQKSVICDEGIKEGLTEVEAIREQLQKLQMIVNQEISRPSINECEQSLIKENDALRRQLLEKDQLIDSLRQQLAAVKL